MAHSMWSLDRAIQFDSRQRKRFLLFTKMSKHQSSSHQMKCVTCTSAGVGLTAELHDVPIVGIMTDSPPFSHSSTFRCY